MKVILIILGLILAVPVAFRLFISYTVAKMRREHPELLDDTSLSEEELAREQEQADRRQAILERLVVYRNLKENVKEGMELDALIDAFRQMCLLPVGDPDDLLFETGTFNFTGEKLFYFSLVRQFQFLDDDEYVQLHLEVTYLPSAKTALLSDTHWGSLTQGDFWETVKNSRAYRVAKELPMYQVQVFVDET